MTHINQQQMLPLGTMLDHRYRIVRYLGSGGFGNTYVAVHTLLGEQVAVKEFFMRGVNHRSVVGSMVEVSNEENTTVFNSQLEKFRREARRIFKLHNDHIIHVTDLFDANGTSYYVMDLIPGSSLADRRLPLSEKETISVAMQVLDALEAMHAEGLYHLDVKPSNIMCNCHDHYTLIDFGASKQLSVGERNTVASSSMAYTPGYAPLEQVQQNSKSIGPWTDFFALGATLYKLLTGFQPPLVEVYDTAPDGRKFDYPTVVSTNMRYAISTLMNPNPLLRPQTANKVRELLGFSTITPTKKTRDTAEEQTRLDSENTVFEKDEKTRRDKVSRKTKSLDRSTLNSILHNIVNNMVEVEGGTFMMGKEYSWLGGRGKDNVAHEVTLSSFAIGRTLVTQREWKAIMGKNPSYFKGDDLPVESVTWEECLFFVVRLNELTNKLIPEERFFRLPTEAEWEFAARGGVKSQGYEYAGSNDIDSVAWYNLNSGRCTHPVGQKKPNELGLYDMSGNVWERCLDWYDKYFYKRSPKINPVNNEQSSNYKDPTIIVDRGGCWSIVDRDCRVNYRSYFYCGRYFSLGLRLVLSFPTNYNN